MESFSAYARSFIGTLERPNVDKINGLSPVISIEQKTTSRNPRSIKVGTLTEIYDFLRLLYARASTAYSHASGENGYSDYRPDSRECNQDVQSKKVVLAAPVVKGRKGHTKNFCSNSKKRIYKCQS